jgi:hypothetical protein
MGSGESQALFVNRFDAGRMLLVQSPDDVSAVPPATGTQLRRSSPSMWLANLLSESGEQPHQLTKDVGGGMDLVVGAETPVDEPQPGLGGHDHGLAGDW